MEKLKATYKWYLNQNKRTRILIGFAAIILTLAALECLTGCSNYGLTKTWSF